MPLTTNQIAVAMFGIAAGGFKAEIDAHLTNHGEVATVAALLPHSGLNPTFLGQEIYTNQQFAEALVTKMMPGLGTTVATATANIIVNYMSANPALTRAEVVVALITAIDAMPHTDTTYGTLAANFDHQVALADAYNGTSTDLNELAQVIGNQPVQAGQTLALTTGVDNIVLTNTNKEVVGIVDTNNSVSTLNAGDVIVGTGISGGKLRVIQDDDSYPGSATITNVETIEVQVGAGWGVNFNATGVTGAQLIEMVQAVGTQAVSNIGSLDTAVGIRNTTQDLLAYWEAALLTGKNDAVTVQLDTATGGINQGVAVSDGVEVVNLKTKGGASDINDITDGTGNTSLKTLNIAAETNVRIRALDADINKIDASASTANVRIRTNNSGDLTFIGGKGDDRLEFGAGNFNNKDTASGGDGVDRLDIGLTASVAQKNNITGFETIGVESNGAYTLNLDGNADVQTIAVREDGNTDTVTLTNLAQVLQNVVYEGDESNGNQTFDNLTANLAAGKGTGASDSTTVTVTNFGTALGTLKQFNLGTLTLPSVENVTIDVQDGDAVFTALSDTALKTLTVSGTGNVDMGATLNSTKLTTVNATGVTKAFTVDTSISNESVTISLGNGKNEVTIGDGNGNDDITTVNLGSGANTVALTYDNAGGANGFAVITGFDAGKGGDVIDLASTLTFEKVVNASTAPTTGNLVVVSVQNAANDQMTVSGSDEAALVSDFRAFANNVTFDNNGTNNDTNGFIYVVQGNDGNAYMFRVDAEGTDGLNPNDATETVQLLAILTGVNTADLYVGNFI